MSLAIMVEYHFGIPAVQSHFDSTAMLQQAKARAEMKLTYLTLGTALFVPSDGETMMLRNTDRDPNSVEGVDIELRLTRDEVCSILSPKPALQEEAKPQPLQHELSVNASAAATTADEVSNSVNNFDFLKLKKGPNSNTLDVKKSLNRENMTFLELDEGEFSDGIMVGFDVKAYHPNPSKGEIKHGQNIEELVNLMPFSSEKGPVEDGIASLRKESVDDADLQDSLRSSRLKISLRESVGSSRPLQASFANRSMSSFVPDADLGNSKRRNNELPIRVEDLPLGSRFVDDEAEAVASIVTGDSEHSSIRLDYDYYRSKRASMKAGKQDAMPPTMADIELDPPSDKHFRVPRDKSSLLAQSLQTKLVSKVQGQSDTIDPRSARRISHGTPFIGEDLQAAPKTMVTVMNGNAAYVRELTRGARSRLNRHGFDGALQDSALPFGTVGAVSRMGPAMEAASGVDLLHEASDPLCLNEINIQFAGCRFGSLVHNAQRGQVTTFYDQNCPKRIYFSFQFFSCMPTRTEILRLVAADNREKATGPQFCVLARDEAYARDDPPLVLRYMIDGSAMQNSSSNSPSSSQSLEAIEFAEYLLRESLYVDVWDAESALHIGTCGIPLRKLLRSHLPAAKMAIECDIIDYESASSSQSGVTTCTVTDGGPIAGDIIGSVQVILSNTGHPGKASSGKTSILSEEKAIHDSVQENVHGASLEGLNWRAFGVHRDLNTPQQHSTKSRGRPTNSTRAKPLSESAPELRKALIDVRELGSGPSYAGQNMRSLTAARGGQGASTLTYDEIAILFKRFQGVHRGTVQYSGALMDLLDMPSWNIAVRKLIQVYKLVGDHERFKMVYSVCVCVCVCVYCICRVTFREDD
jgi:hypothetical protein